MVSYSKSQLDKNNSKWFKADNTRASLRGISLDSGSIRGLTTFKVNFDYPIVAFSGGNGSGKSTVLAIATCAFHNSKKGFTPSMRAKPYYTFSDFFIQSKDEGPVEDVSISYKIQHNAWKSSKPGIAYQSRKKAKNGKWTDYDRRVHRNVVYFGIQRVVPHYERTTHKTYSRKFKEGLMGSENRERIYQVASRVIGKKYTSFKSYEHGKYTLPVAEVGGISYSGFNMGAGEGSVFEILTALFRAGPGSLLVIDEIELGLHEMAQVRLIEELKKLCLEFKCQIICSTHSHAILRSLPPEGRFHLENIVGKTFVTRGASADFACGKMGMPDAHELDIFVEDKVGVELLQAVFSADIRRRTRVISIGSAAAVVRQLASRKLENVDACLCILDGDQNGTEKTIIGIAQSACEASTEVEKEEISSWIKDRVFYLPGSEWPEKWLINQARKILDDLGSNSADELVQSWGVGSRELMISHFEEADGAKKHNEFYDLV